MKCNSAWPFCRQYADKFNNYAVIYSIEPPIVPQAAAAGVIGAREFLARSTSRCQKSQRSSAMRTETVAIAALKAPPNNVRVHPEQQIVEFMRAIQKFGQARPVVIDDESVILAGNGLVEACRRLNHSEVVAYRMTGLSPADNASLMLSDNRIYSLGLDDHGAIIDGNPRA